MPSNKQSIKANSVQKKTNANATNEMELMQNERRITLTLRAKLRQDDCNTQWRDDSSNNNICLAENNTNDKVAATQHANVESVNKKQLFVRTCMLNETSKVPFPVPLSETPHRTAQLTSLSNTSTPHKLSSQRSVNATIKRHDVPNNQTNNSPEELSLLLWSWQEVINLSSLRRLCDDNYINTVQVVEHIERNEEINLTTPEQSTNLFGNHHNKESNKTNVNERQNKKRNSTMKLETITKPAKQTNNVKLKQQQENLLLSKQEKEEENQEKYESTKQNVHKKQGNNAKIIEVNEQLTNEQRANNRVSVVGAINISAATTKNKAVNALHNEVIVAEEHVFMSDILHSTSTTYLVKLEVEDVNWIESCWLELKCEPTPLLNSELVALYRPVTINLEVSNYKKRCNNDKDTLPIELVKTKNQTKQNMWLRVSAFDQVKMHYIVSKSDNNNENVDNDDGSRISSNVNKNNSKINSSQTWQTVFFLGDIPMLDVYRFFFSDKLKIELFACESGFSSNDNNVCDKNETTRYNFAVQESSLVGEAHVSLKQYLVFHQTYYEEMVYLLPSQHSLQMSEECNLTFAPVIVVGVNFHIPFPPLLHVREDGSECIDEFLTCGVIVMPYADTWVGKVIETLIWEVKQLPAVNAHNNGALYLYTPQDAETEIHNTEITNKSVASISNAAKAMATVNDKKSEETETKTKELTINKSNKEGKLHRNNTKQEESSQGGNFVTTTKNNSGFSKEKTPSVQSKIKDNANPRRNSRRNSHACSEVEQSALTEENPSTFSIPFHVVTPNVISGFEVMDGCYRVIVIEGAVRDVQHILESITVAANNHPALRVLFNSSLFIPYRSYGFFPSLVTLPEESRLTNGNNLNKQNEASVTVKDDLEHNEAEAGGTGGRVHRVRLSEPLEAICEQKKYWLHRILSEPCAECIYKLSALVSSPSCQTMREAIENNLLPSSAQIVALERAFGQTLSTLDLYSTSAETTATVANTTIPTMTETKSNTCVTNINNNSEKSITFPRKARLLHEYKNVSCEKETCEAEHEYNLRKQLSWTSLSCSHVNKIVSFDGVIDLAKTRKLHKILPETLRTRYKHVCYMTLQSTRNKFNFHVEPQQKEQEQSLELEEQEWEEELQNVAYKTKRITCTNTLISEKNSVLCGFVNEVPAPSITYHVDGQIVQHNSHVLVHILLLERLSKERATTHNAEYETLLRQRQHELRYRLLHNKLKRVPTEDTKHTKESAALQDEQLSTKTVHSISCKEEEADNSKVDNKTTITANRNDCDNDDVWLVDKSWEEEEIHKKKEFVQYMKRKDAQRHTIRQTNHTTKLASMHKQPTKAEKVVEYALWWKLYNARAPATELIPTKHGIMRF